MTLDRISPPSALLLLPPAPSSASFEQLQQAYKPSVAAACAQLPKSLKNANHIAVLDIAFCVPGSRSPSCLPRGRVFAGLQRLLADMYKLIGIVGTEQGVDLDIPGGINVRIIFLDFDPIPGTMASTGRPQIAQHGPIIDLETLASSGRLWDWVFYSDNASGQALAAAFSTTYCQSEQSATAKLQSVPGGVERTSPGSLFDLEDKQASAAHYSVAVGGTFDHVHLGHKLLLTATVLALEPIQDTNPAKRLVTIGVTGDALLVNKKYAAFLESWDERCQSAASFLSAIIDFRPPEKSAPSIQGVSQPGPNGRYVLNTIWPGLVLKLVEISDPFGPTITDETITAIVVSKETWSGGAMVNDERAKKGWKGLEVFAVDVLQSGDVPAPEAGNFASKISSTDIRRRRMDLAKR